MRSRCKCVHQRVVVGSGACMMSENDRGVHMYNSRSYLHVSYYDRTWSMQEIGGHKDGMHVCITESIIPGGAESRIMVSSAQVCII